MGGIIGLLLLTVLCSSVNTVRGECRQVENVDLIEYSCVGGELSDLDSLPASTGKIRISNMPIFRITKNTFSRFGSDLWVLGCSHCGIRDIEPDAFQRLDNLQQLSLNNNYLLSVKESWFRGLNYLTYLDLNYNNIHTIEDGVFQNLPSLVDLRLSGNRLECLNLEDMSNLKELKRIFLTENSEFKCPNAVSAYLADHGVSFEKDVEWDRIRDDEIQPPVSDDYEYYYDTTTTMPTYRERLHLTTTTTTEPPETTSPYIPPRFQTTEDVVYRPVYHIPDWKTPPPQTTTTPREEESPYWEQNIRGYNPPRTIAPLESDRDSQMTDDTQLSVDETTLRPWPIQPYSRPVYQPVPPYRNEDKNDEESFYSSRDSFPLAPGQVHDHEMPSFVGSNMERTTESQTIDQQLMSRGGYPVITDSSSVQQPMQSRDPDSRPPANYENIIPSDYEHPVHPPPSVGNPEATMVVAMTTTDKPLPNCPSSSSPIQRSVELFVLSILMVFVRNAFVEGF